MRKWKSTKIYEAEKIVGFRPVSPGVCELVLSGGELVKVTHEWIKKHSNGKGTEVLVGGWFVRYPAPNEYESWHPKGYEEGHVEVTE